MRHRGDGQATTPDEGYRVQYSPTAEDALDAMGEVQRARFETGMRALAAAPYGQDSEAIKGERDYRQAYVPDAIIVYYVSAGVLLVTVVRIVHGAPRRRRSA